MVKRGDNIRFICTYLFNNPGATYTQIRSALCEARGVDPRARRGQYCWYFLENRGVSWNPRTYVVKPRSSEDRWRKRDGRYFLTEKGLAWVSPS